MKLVQLDQRPDGFSKHVYSMNERGTTLAVTRTHFGAIYNFELTHKGEKTEGTALTVGDAISKANIHILGGSREFIRG